MGFRSNAITVKAGPYAAARCFSGACVKESSMSAEIDALADAIATSVSLLRRRL